MMMSKHSFLILAILLLTFGVPSHGEAQAPTIPQPGEPIRPAASPLAPAATISLDEIQRGQLGYGLSVFAGSETERFEVEVLGVLRDFSPQSSAIIARLSGQNLEQSGVIAGMSGSPVYIDGRLAGAVAFSWNYAKEAIAGITPIAAMRQIPLFGVEAASPRGALPPLSLAALQRGDAPADLLEQQLRSWMPALAEGAASGVVWSASGFGTASRSLLSRGLGTVASSGHARPQSEGSANLGTAAVDLASVLAPGTPVAGVLVQGDLQLAATGTVTDRFGDEVLAFGHPFLGFGPLRLPMAAAEVITVIASTANSFKLSNLGPVVGAFEQDRQAGVYGRVGALAPTVPFSLTVSGDGIADSRTFHMEMANVKLLLPTLFAISTAGALDSAGHASGPQGLEMKATLRLKGHDAIALEQSFESNNAATEAAIYLLTVAANALHTELAEAEAEGLEVTLVRYGAVRKARILSVHGDRSEVRPGETVKVFVELQHQDGGRERRVLSVVVPEETPEGSFALLIADGATADATRFLLEPAAPTQYGQLLANLASLHSRQDLAVLGLIPEGGLIVGGEVLQRLPGSVRSLWAGSAPGTAQPLALALASQQYERMDRPLEGLARLDLKVRRR